MKRKYEKIVVDKEEFIIDVTSGNLTTKEIQDKYKISKRNIYYLTDKYNVKPNTKSDPSYITPEYKEKISKKLKGLKRSEQQIYNYKKAASKRGNNRVIGEWNHSEETKNKIRQSNLITYKNKPQKWLDSCINNPNWFKKLRKIDIDKLSEWEKYVYDVRSLSYRNARKYKNVIEGEKSEGYHLDHIVSISEAFNNQLDVEIASSHHNLRYIPSHQNLSKNSKSDITIEELKNKYYGK